MQVPLILVSGQTRKKWQYEADRNGQLAPRQDYVEIARRLDGKLYGYDLSTAGWYSGIRRLEQRLRLDLLEAFLASRQYASHNVILSTSEKMAIPLAILFRFARQTPPHVVIAHKLSSGHKRTLFRLLKVHKTFSHIICVCRAQAEYAINELGVSASAVDFVYDKVDHHFFRPIQVESENYILAVGQEQRDYETLAEAVAGTGLKLVVVASSPWSTSQTQPCEAREATVLSNIPYQKLRMLYAMARLVVVPLNNVDYAAGVNTVLEAMAMGKTVVVSHTSGIRDYIVQNETGILVTPKNPFELRDVLLSIWGNNKKLDRLGMNGRQAIQDGMNLESYVEQISRIVENLCAGQGRE